mgnify:CR=1 FL=1
MSRLARFVCVVVKGSDDAFFFRFSLWEMPVKGEKYEGREDT